MSPRTRKALRWTRRIILGFLALIVLAVGGALIFIHTDKGRSVVRGIVEAKLSDTFVGGAKVGKIEGSPFGELVLRDLVINDPEGQPAISIGRLAIELRLLPLIRQQARLTSLEIDDLDVNLRRDAQGELMISRMTKPGPKSGWGVELSHLRLRRGNVAVDMPDEDLHIDGIEASGSATIPAMGAIATTVGVRANWRERNVPIALDAIVRTDEGVTDIFRLAASAGGVRVLGTQLRIATSEGALPPKFSGTVSIEAPKRDVKKLVPTVELPDDVSATIVVRDADPLTQLRVTARVGATHAQILAAADLINQRVQGTVTTDRIDLPTLTKGGILGSGGALIAFDANAQKFARGVVTAWGQVNDLPRLETAIAFDTDGKRALARVGVAGPALLAAIGADVDFGGERVILERSSVFARTTSPNKASGGKAPVSGAIDVNLTASGQLLPTQNLAVSGRVKGKRLRMQDMSVSELDLAIEAKELPRAPKGKVELRLEDIVRGDMQLGQLKLTGANRPDGTIAVALRSRPKFAPWLVDLDALIAPPSKPREKTWTVDLVKHRVRIDDKGEWTGTTGHLEIGPGHYAIENFASASQYGQFSLSASIAAHHLDIDFAAQRDKLGTARVAVDVDAPVEFTNPVAWKRLKREAIREAKLEVKGINLAEVATLLGREGEVSGRLDALFALTPETMSGTLDVTGVKTPQTAKFGALNVGLTIAQPEKDELVPTLIGNLAGVGRFQATARIALPKNPLDPVEWKAAGPKALRGANVVVDEILLEPGLMDKFGVTSELRGRVKLAAEVGEGAKSANLRLDVAQLRGAPLTSPIDARVELAVDDKLATAGALVTAGKLTLVDAKAELPLSLDQLIANPQLAQTTPVKGTAIIPTAKATQLLAVFGRSEAVGGTIGGKIAFSGTLAAPKVTANITGEKLEAPPGPRNQRVKVLDKLAIDGSFENGVAKARIQGTQNNGYLDVAATINPANIEQGKVTVKAQRFDLQPLLVFAPGTAGAARGRLDADLTVEGLDPVKAKIAGTLKLTNARVPIAPQVGTLRRANMDIAITQNAITINADGKLGPGTVKLVGKIGIEGARPTSGTATLTLRKVSPIGTVEPVIDSDIVAKVRRESDKWVADVTIKNTNIVIPDDRDNEALKPVGAPPDIIYASGEKLTERPMEKEPPKKAVIVANVTLDATHIESKELRTLIKGKVTVSADAEAVGVMGTIEAYRGDLDLFGRRYQVDRAAVQFDGTTDPLLDLRIIHDFPDVTTVTAVRGRLSKPELVMSSDPGIYSQSQLLGFLLGGEPNGDPQSGSAREVATSAGASFIANQIGGYVKKVLPVDIDVIRYEAASVTESANITVGTWLTRSWFIAYKRRLESRPDENANQAEVEYWLSRRVLVEGATGDRAVSGVDLLWRKRY